MDEIQQFTDCESSPENGTVSEPRRNKGGRPPGSRNKKLLKIEQFGPELAQGNVREIFFAAFDALDGLKGLVNWGKKNPERFYALFARMGPRAAGGRRVSEAPSAESPVEIEDFSGE